jgi:G3E family GTPase
MMAESQGFDALCYWCGHSSQVSDPGPILVTLEHPELRQAVWLAGVVAVVDAEAFKDEYYDR